MPLQEIKHLRSHGLLHQQILTHP